MNSLKRANWKSITANLLFLLIFSLSGLANAQETTSWRQSYEKIHPQFETSTKIKIRNNDNLIALSKYSFGDYRSAIDSASKSFKADPLDVLPITIMAWSHFQLEDYSQACEYANRALEIVPKYYDALLVRSRCSEMITDYYQMLEDLRKLSRIDKQTFYPILNGAALDYSHFAQVVIDDLSPEIKAKIIAQTAQGKVDSLFSLDKLIYYFAALLFLGTVIVFVSKGILSRKESAPLEKEEDVLNTQELSVESIDMGKDTIADKYKIEKVIGGGNSGVVFKAKNIIVNLDVAIKRIEVSLSQMEREIFIQSLKKLEVIKHECVSDVFQVIEEDKYIYIVTELIDGVTLYEKLDTSGTFGSFEEVEPILSDLCRALEYLHSNAIVHGGLKPSDIIIDSQGVSKILNSALALFIERENEDERDFLAPEIFEGKPTEKSDIYSLAMCIKACLPKESDIPDKLKRIVERSLSKNPQERPSIKEFCKYFNG
jgi:tetratricopeptide (TPR) repeat protein